jgi:hypothetical protein
MSSVGARTFDVFLDSTRVKEDLDIFDEVGSATAYVFEQNFEVTDWSLEVSFGRKTQNPKVSCVTHCRPWLQNLH